MPYVWMVLTIPGLGLALDVFLLVYVVSGADVFQNGQWLESSGLWTAVVAVFAAPIAWFAWIIRDFGKVEDRRHAASVAAREHFNLLREWALDTEGMNRVAAVYELDSYFDVESPANRIPVVIKEERKWYATSTEQFFAELVRSRQDWDKALRSIPIEGEVPKGNYTIHLPHDSFRYAISRIIVKRGHRIHDFRNADLRYLDLEGANLKGALLVESDLRWTVLEGANLDVAHIERSNLSHSRLSDARLHRARLIMSKTDSVQFTDADLSDAKILGVRFQNSVFFGTNLQGAVMKHASFDDCTLGGANFGKARLSNTTFRRSDLGNTDWTATVVVESRFAKCGIEKARIERRLNRQFRGCKGEPEWIESSGTEDTPQEDGETG